MGFKANSQTPGTTSINPIVIAVGTSSLTNQSPDSLVKWYQLTLSNPNVALNIKSLTQGTNLPLVSAEFFIYDSSKNLLTHLNDSLQADSTLFFNIQTVPIGAQAFVKFNFNANCSNCKSLNTTFNIYINAYAVSNACTNTPTGCEIVYNGSFEDFTIPCSAMGIQAPYNPYPACNWLLPSNCTTTVIYVGTPDYYNSCYTSPSSYNYYGTNFYTSPNTGNASAGLILFAYSSDGPLIAYNYREYLQQQLTTPLTSNQKYSLNIYVKANNVSKYLTNKLYAYFDYSFPCQNSYSVISTSSLTGQMLQISPTAFTNTSGWQLYSLTFTASAAYSHLTLGNFNNDLATIPSLITNAPGTFSMAYIYVDDISIKPTADYTVSASSFSICSGLSSTLTINGSAGNTYTWQPGNLTGTLNTVTPPATTIYTITATNSLGCTQSTFVPITVLNLAKKLNISAFPDRLCTGNTTTLNANGIGIATYTWLPSNTQNTLLVTSPTITTTYSLIVTSVSGCTSSAVKTITVDITPTITAASATNVICTNFASTSNTLTAFITAGIGYTWQPGSLSASLVIVSPTTTTIYTVSTTSYSNVCIASNTVLVFVQNACCSSTLPAFSSGNFPSGTTTYSNALVFNANVTLPVNANVNLYTAEFLFAPGVSVAVSNGAKLDISTAHLHACSTTMWQGIVINDGGKIRSAKNNLIEDAIVAIDATGNFTSTVTPNIIEVANTIFNKNYIAIKIDGYQRNFTPYPFSIYSSVFTSRNFTYTPSTWPNVSVLLTATSPTTALAPPYNLQNAPVVNALSPYNSRPSQIGILLNNVGATTSSVFPVTIGESSYANNFNLFDNLAYGLYATNSNVNNVNAAFQNILYFGPCRGGCLMGGSAIFSAVTTTFNANLNISSCCANPSLGNRFWNCYRGVEAQNLYQFNATYATLRSTQSTTAGTSFLPGNTGFVLNTNRFQYYITNNEFSNIANPINIPIVAGTYNVGSGNQTGIYAANMIINSNYFGAQTNTATALGTNYINNALSVTGVNSTTWTTQALTQLQIKNNIIDRVYRGISLNGMNGYPSLIQGNTIKLVDDNLFVSTQKGIEVVNTQNATVVFSNTLTGANTTNTLVNLVYAGSNNGTNSPSITCNALSNSYNGFVFDNANTGTNWYGNTMQTHARGMSLVNSATISTQGSSGNPQDNQWLGTWTGASYGTFVEIGSSAINSKLYVKSGNPWLPLNNGGSALFPDQYVGVGNLIITTGAFSCGGGGSSSAIITNGSASSLNSAANTGASSSNIVLSSEAKYIANTSQYRTNPSANTAQVSTSIGKFTQIEQAFYTGNSNGANSLNAAISATNAVEQNYKMYNGIYYNYITGNYSTSDSSNLYTLAGLCPGTNGAVVYQARALYNSIYKTILVFNANCGNTSSGARVLKINANGAGNAPETKWNADLFPNPAATDVAIISKTASEQLTVRICDINGKLITVKNITTNGFICKLDVELTNGIYLVTITNATNLQSVTKKLVVNNY
ncbi:MAG: T9SS type A sorting domain-containing protein [Bacteroidetes bacterium]|nr:T9SS type A sorting domain-containing protein [Bacteroidota bacterium]